MTIKIYHIVMFVIVGQSLTSAGETLFAPWHQRKPRQSSSENQATENIPLCKLPPYPDRGRYLVVGERSARPGDVRQNASLVQYELNASNDTFDIKYLSCSSGKWSNSTFHYQSEILHFDPSWCPVLCLNLTAAASANSTKSYIEKKENATASNTCKIPPLIDEGAIYYHTQLPNLKPGDTFESISKLFQLTLNDSTGLYEIKNFVCIKGWWRTLLFQKGETLGFGKDLLCSLVCSPTPLEKPSVPQLKTFVNQVRSPYLPLRSTLTRSSDSEDSVEELCELPAYPQSGRYFVVDEPEAKPGDLFQDVSLVQYMDNNKNVEIKVLNCSSGRWTESIFQYRTENLYFNSSWCPIVCSSFRMDNTTESAPEKGNETTKATNNNMSEDRLCRIPPYPKGGGYHLLEKPTARPGYTFKTFYNLYRYIFDETTGIYELKRLNCNEGAWFATVSESESDAIYVNKNNWCPVVCPSSTSGNLSDSVPEEPAKVLKAPYLPLVTVYEKGDGSAKKQLKAELCELPPYPKNGSYLAVGRPGAAPGDLVDAVTLVLYQSLNESHIEIRAENCSLGQWTQGIFQHLSRSLYFDTAWCPYLCLPSDSEATSEDKGSSTTSNEDDASVCTLPPYRQGGSYLVHGIPGARPGDRFDAVTISQYTPDPGRKFYEIEEFRCANGNWFRTLFLTEDDKLYFNKKLWCPLLCPIFRNNSTEQQ